MTQITA